MTWSTDAIPGRVREYRERAGLTQEDLARKLGMRQPHISAIESGRLGLSLERLLAMAEALGCSPSDLVDDPRKKSTGTP